MKNMTKSGIVFCLILLLVFVSCKNSDERHPEASTRHNLDIIGAAACRLFEEGVKKEDFSSLSVFLRVAKDSGAITEEDFLSGRYEKDYWGRSFHWVYSSHDGEDILRVRSCGVNGIDEGGKQDDLLLEVRFSPATKPLVILKPLP